MIRQLQFGLCQADGDVRRRHAFVGQSDILVAPGRARFVASAARAAAR